MILKPADLGAPKFIYGQTCTNTLMPFPYQKIQCAHLCAQTIYPVLFLFPVVHSDKHSPETLMASIGVVPGVASHSQVNV